MLPLLDPEQMQRMMSPQGVGPALPMQPPMGNMAPQMAAQAQEPQQAASPFASMFSGMRGNFGPVLQSVGMALAANNPAVGATAFQQIMEQRRQQAQTVQQEQQAGQTRNRTAQWLRANGREDLAGAMETGALDASQAVKMFYEGQKAQQGNNEQLGLSPIWGRDAEGNIRAYQIGNQGTLKQLEADGVTFFDPVTMAGDKAAATTAAKIRGEAAANLPIKSAGYQKAMSTAKSILEDPALDSNVGMIQGRLPNFARGESGMRFVERVEKLKGEAFLQARTELKGGGQITDYEGQRAEAALLRASLAKSEEDFRAAILEFQDAITRGYQALEAQAGVAPQDSATDIDALLRKYGQ